MIGAVVPVLVGSPAGSQPPTPAPEPTISIETRTPRQGPLAVVHLEHWPAGPVTVSVCGNGGRRGSEDCDSTGAQSGTVDRAGTATVPVPPPTPPIGCPCVLRVSGVGGDLVRHAVIDLPGVPTLAQDQLLPAVARVPASKLAVSARIDDASTSWTEPVIAAFGGSAPRQVTLTVRNTAAVPMTNLTITAAVGPSAASGAPLRIEGLSSLAPAEQRIVTARVDAPAMGSSVVHGRIFGLEEPVAFEASTESRPWGLVTLGGATVVAGLARLRRRWRLGRRARAGTAV